jgi:1-acyl-sn-glycerol-3-phosphate acyltransferase
MTVLPRWVRRCVTPILLVLALVVSLAAFLATVVPLALLSAVWSPARRSLRLLVFALVVLGTELVALVVAFGLWSTRSGADAHYRALGHCVHVLVRTASRLFALDPDDEIDDWPTDRLRGSSHALLVLCRHAGPGDSIILLDALINRYGLRPWLVMKQSMRLDPVVDVYFDRLPAVFVSPGDDDGESAQRSIRHLARNIGGVDTLVMFPEGGNYTPRRHRRAIRRLARTGHHSDAARARRLRNVMPPRPGGVLAVLDEVDVDVLVIGHSGLGRLHSTGDVWRLLEDPKPVGLKAWFTPFGDVPRDRKRRVGWLFDLWTTVDLWVETESCPSRPPPAEGDDAIPAT